MFIILFYGEYTRPFTGTDTEHVKCLHKIGKYIRKSGKILGKLLFENYRKFCIVSTDTDSAEFRGSVFNDNQYGMRNS